MAAIYEHTQWAWTIAGVFAAAIVVLLLASGGGPFFWWPSFALLAIWGTFSSLTVRIEGDTLSWWFGPKLWSYERPVTRIVSAEPVENRWWYGWGIRATPHGWLYNVSGLSAVEITMADGSRLRIGTDAPMELTEAIRAARR
ncbi:MAG: hypothetical protein ACFBRM_04340 [Pikeienuella sp.]